MSDQSTSEQSAAGRLDLHEPDENTGTEGSDDDAVQPHPRDESPESGPGRKDDDSPVDRYRDSPGAALLDESREPAEPNEPA